MNAGYPNRLAAEFELYEARKLEWLQNHRDEFVVIKGIELLGFFPNFHLAYSAGAQKYGINTDFLVKRVVPQETLFEVF